MLNFQGILGFYKGITASYFGISETVIHFVIYEAIKAELISRRMQRRALLDEEFDSSARSSRDFFEFMIAGAFSKTVASCLTYPHGKFSQELKKFSLLADSDVRQL